MKKLYTLLTAVILTANAFAQTPQAFKYQAVVRDSAGILIANQAISIRAAVVADSANGMVVYQETHSVNSNQFGLINLQIGSGSAIFGTFSSIDWSGGTYFIKTETDPTGGTNYTITGTSQLMSVPYALHAKTADSITGTGGSSNDFYLGQDTLGGIVYYIYIGSDNQQHGLIVNKTESTAVWQATGTLTNADRTEDGAYNTGLMTSSAAATYVTSLGVGWYLPSIDELGLLYYNRFSANKALRAGGFTLLSKTANYWSSTEDDTTNAYDFNFDYGHAEYYSKDDIDFVRAVRAF
jgi:hypothetical protein